MKFNLSIAVLSMCFLIGAEEITPPYTGGFGSGHSTVVQQTSQTPLTQLTAKLIANPHNMELQRQFISNSVVWENKIVLEGDLLINTSDLGKYFSSIKKRRENENSRR